MGAAQVDELEVLHGGVVTAQAEELDAEHDVDLAATDEVDKVLKAGELRLVGAGGEAVIKDDGAPALNAGVGGELIALDSETMRLFATVLARLADYPASAARPKQSSAGHTLLATIDAVPDNPAVGIMTLIPRAG